MPQPLRFVSWAAVSSLPQAKKISLGDQVRLNREHIDRWGGTLVGELMVPGESRSIVLFEQACQRIQAYQRLGEMIQERAFDVLIYYDRSRLGRKASLSMAIVELCREIGASVYEVENPPASLDELRRPSTHDDQLIGAIKSVGAQQEVERLRERHRRGMRERVRRGQFPSKPIFGYAYAYTETGERKVVVVGDQSEVVRLIFSLYLDGGMGVPSIRQELETRGVLTPTGKRDWHSVRKILRSVWTYAGYAEYNQTRGKQNYLRAPGSWEAIVSEEQAEAVDEEVRRRARGGTGWHRRRYSMVLVCGVCGSHVVVGGVYQMAGAERVQYRCSRGCKGGSIYDNRVTKELSDELAAIQVEGVAGFVPVRDDRERERVEREIAVGVAGLSGVEEERLRLARLVVRGNLSEDEHDVLLREITEREAGLESRLVVARQRQMDLADVEKRVIRLQEVAEAGPGILTGEDERAVNAWLRRHVRVYVAGNHVEAVEWV